MASPGVERKKVQTELDAVSEYYGKLEDRCVAKEETFVDRMRRREAEIRGLKEALEILGENAVMKKDVFSKVKQLIKDMIQRLEKEQDEDKTEKAYCKNQTKGNAEPSKGGKVAGEEKDRPQARDWSGSGEFSCYGHVSTDVSSPEGGDHLGEGTLNCNIIEWGGGPLGPEAMFFKPNGGAEFEIWAWDYHDWDSEHWPMPYATCEGQIWYKRDDMGAGYCTPHRGFTGCGYGHCVGDIVCIGC